MGDIDFEEQLELERLEKEKLEKEGDHPKEKVDPDGTVYEWDAAKKAWFPKVDANFIAQYQMNYGVPSGSGEDVSDEQKQAEYYNYYQNYYAAQVQSEQILNKKKAVSKEDTTEEVLGKLEHLENAIQSGEAAESEEYQSDSKEDMEKYTEEQKKSYNEYWSYYYGTDNHDYYSDCMAQFNQQTTEQPAGEEQKKGEDGKKKKKRKAPVQEKREEGWFHVDEKDNTNVYVSGLPSDITMEEFKEMMTKFGLVMHDPRRKQPKLKLYYDENGQPKGDGRCCYIKKESVDLALNLLDGSDLRGKTIKVERAQFSMKGDYDPSKKKKKLTNKEKNRMRERQEKLFDWRPERPRGARLKHEKVVILKNIFDPKEFEDDPTKINTLSSEMRLECTKYGDVKKVVVYDRHLDGVVVVHFKEAEEADLCVTGLHQRWFAKRRVLAETWDGKSKYEVLETEQEREARLKKWETYLETGETAPSEEKQEPSSTVTSASPSSTVTSSVSSAASSSTDSSNSGNRLGETANESAGIDSAATQTVSSSSDDASRKGENPNVGRSEDTGGNEANGKDGVISSTQGADSSKGGEKDMETEEVNR